MTSSEGLGLNNGLNPENNRDQTTTSSPKRMIEIISHATNTPINVKEIKPLTNKQRHQKQALNLVKLFNYLIV